MLITKCKNRTLKTNIKKNKLKQYQTKKKSLNIIKAITI